jgi:hypothetical protein
VTSPWAAFDGNDIRPLGACANSFGALRAILCLFSARVARRLVHERFVEAQRPERWGRPALLRTGSNPRVDKGTR